jgi:hypothetical protein
MSRMSVRSAPRPLPYASARVAERRRRLNTASGFGPVKSGRTQVVPRRGPLHRAPQSRLFLVGAIEHLPGWVTVP